MITIIQHISDPSALTEACRALDNGNLIAIPTDTVYGLAARLNDAEAINALFLVKGRDAAKAIPVLVGGTEQLKVVSPGWPPAAEDLAAAFWPGALTLIIPRFPHLPNVLSSQLTVGVRMPNHAFTLRLLEKTGPLAVTSANISGGANSISAQDVLAQLSGSIPLILDGGTCSGGIPSTVVDCTGQEVKILREGAIGKDSVFEVLHINGNSLKS